MHPSNSTIIWDTILNPCPQTMPVNSSKAPLVDSSNVVRTIICYQRDRPPSNETRVSGDKCNPRCFDSEDLRYQSTQPDISTNSSCNHQCRERAPLGTTIPLPDPTVNGPRLATIVEHGSCSTIPAYARSTSHQQPKAMMHNGILGVKVGGSLPVKSKDSSTHGGKGSLASGTNFKRIIGPHAQPGRKGGASYVHHETIDSTVHRKGKRYGLKAHQGSEKEDEQGGHCLNTVFGGVIRHIRSASQRNESLSRTHIDPNLRPRGSLSDMICSNGPSDVDTDIASADQKCSQSASCQKGTTKKLALPSLCVVLGRVVGLAQQKQERKSQLRNPSRRYGPPDQKTLDFRSTHEADVTANCMCISLPARPSSAGEPLAQQQTRSSALVTPIIPYPTTKSPPVKQYPDSISTGQPHSPVQQQGIPLHEESAESLLSSDYSGTVLGVDLDLEERHSNMSVGRSTDGLLDQWRGNMPDHMRHRSTPVPPAQYQNKSRDSTASHSPPRHSHSLVSSALPVLLPIAVASGIVEPLHTPSQVTYFSPSGNMVQVSRTPPRGCKARTLSGCRNANTNIIPPPRPRYCSAATNQHLRSELPRHMKPKYP
ncbi:hypothetical protein BU24DRAFT_5758 [Aaosphaeria arxii CBS 175.79]|uniref:Uncharacterized protein n=1 Tax=Aaosphaeria arxii CBS 175.79 TaxID=1450172 RepID=A0A6A5Y7E1_9PLEO|nr:uncharacterized protein BU24DRAFT_5758 [Aaosphaeria arxii CBS 175.79]KAF2020661.1 hypothetical protein BU24DRAFT_5758 [Aaosphaeria arxii CBS 175.79]